MVVVVVVVVAWIPLCWFGGNGQLLFVASAMETKGGREFKVAPALAQGFSSYLISALGGGGRGGLFSLFSRLDQFLWPAFSFHVRWVLYSCLVIPRAGCHYYSPRASGRNKRIVDDERIH